MLRRTHSRPLWPAIALMVLLPLAACAGGGATSPGAESPMESAMGSGDMEEFDFGEPADAADADRVIEIGGSDDFRFDPDQVEVSVGETITFSVTNEGAIDHDFVLGPEAVQDEHEAEMAEGMEHDEPNAIGIGPGETAELTWTFTQAGELLYGCHEPGHYDGGMVGTLTVVE